MAEIIGYAVEVFGCFPFAEHTYVTSSDGHFRFVWPCFGSSDGGHEICKSTGDFNKCNELAGKNSHAEIIYGITGLCHQAANRILIPAATTVENARFYLVSTGLYGTYGTDASRFFHKHHITQMMFIEMPNEDTSEKEFIKNIQDLYSTSNIKNTNANEPINYNSKEFELFLQYRLKKNLSDIHKNKLIEIHEKFHKKIKEMENDLNNKKISPKDYANKINNEISDTLSEFSKELTQEEFEKIFGIKPGEQILLIDPKIMAAEHK